MLAIELKFLTGRYHATPWGRNVNEGVPEWPPSPYRLIRAVFDVWKRKRPDWPESRVEPLLMALASETPFFYLPSASASHTRAFLSENVKNVMKRQLVFDSFVVLEPDSGVVIGWPNVGLESSKRKDLEDLLALINYLGRSESWVAARTLPDANDTKWNCVPADGSVSRESFETIQVACPISAKTYESKPFKLLTPSKKGKPRELTWLETIAWSTADMFASRLSEPPSLQNISYLRKTRCFDVAPTPRRRRREPVVNGVIFSLESMVLPQVTSTLEISERVRRKLMGIHKRIMGDPGKISPKFSGKNADGTPLKGHRHVYILPMDRDSDGRLDHLLVVCREPLDRSEQFALDSLTSIWQRSGRPDVRCIPIQWGKLGDLIGTEPVTRVMSAAPFVPTHHYRRGRGDFGEWLIKEVNREAMAHGLPSPTRVTPVSKLVNHGRSCYWSEFRRNRKKDPVRMGYGFELEFQDPVVGPIALGYGAHFGLGLFVPLKVEQISGDYDSRSNVTK